MTACRFTSTTTPRVLPGRHDADCEDETCRGCQPCTERHCRVCGTEHSEGVCGGCLSDVRDTLAEIAKLCDDLPTEAVHRGVNSEAAHLFGPAADPEARGHLEASVLAGRVPPEYLETADHDQHPLVVLGTWQMVYAAEFEHEDNSRITIAGAAGYLDRNLTYAATWPHVEFADLARDLRVCRTHLEMVLHDGEQVDRGVPCMKCGRQLTRTWGDGKRPDGWECKACREWSTEDQYRFAVTADYIANAEWLTAEHMQVRTQVLATTVRSWAREQPGHEPPLVRKTLNAERVVYNVEDVERIRDAKGLAPCA